MFVSLKVRFVGAPQLVHGPTNQTAFEGETIQLGCGYYSDMEAFVYWKKQQLPPLLPRMGANATNQRHATILQASRMCSWIFFFHSLRIFL